MTPAEIREAAWSLLLDYAAETGTLANECEHAGLDAEEVARIREKATAIRAAASALAGMCVLDVETVRELVAATCAALDDLGWEHCIQHGAGPTVEAALAAAEAELARAEGRR